jgi:hypothetical protein
MTHNYTDSDNGTERPRAKVTSLNLHDFSMTTHGNTLQVNWAGLAYLGGCTMDIAALVAHSRDVTCQITHNN